MKEGMYYVVVYTKFHGQMVMETDEIEAVIIAIRAAREEGFGVRLSPNTIAKLQELQREATREWN